ncbi:FYVE zinc finger domain-containing protein [Phytophthora infestans]|nr:FYVE zinc finger domain-containing protein [Phytophthora infestans]
MEFPLKTDFFPQVRLTMEERRRYVTTGECSARVLRSSMKTLDWKKTMEKDGVTYAQAHCIEGSNSVTSSPFSNMVTSKADEEPHNTASACLIMSATAFAAGTISEALEALASPVTEDYRRAMHFLHGSRFIDGVCLHKIPAAPPNSSKSNSQHQAFTTIKWAAFDDGKALHLTGAPAGTDYCFLEHTGIHRSDPGNDASELFGFSVQESIIREGEVPSLAGVGLARGHLHRTGILILPTDRSDVVQVTSIFQMSMAEGIALGAANDNSGGASNSGKATSAALARLMRRRVAAIGRLELLVERRRLNKLVHVPRAEWVADDARKACAVCVKPFALRRRKHHCRHCGEVVCASCAPARGVDTDSSTTTHVRICTACVVQSRTGAQVPGGFEIFVYHMRNTKTSLSSSASKNSIGVNALTANNNNNAEIHTRPKSLSSGSSTFSISSDSQMSARLTRAGYADGTIRMYDFEDDHLSSNSSSYSLSEFNSSDSLLALTSQDDVERCQRRSSSQGRGSSQLTISSPQSPSSSFEPTDDLLERIRGMKADLSMLTTSYRQFSDAHNFRSAHNFIVDTDTPQSVLNMQESGGAEHDARSRRTRISDPEATEGIMDVDFINSEQFTLLCPDTLSRQWRTRTSSRVRQDAGDKSQLRASISNMSFMSTLSNLAMLGDEENLAARDSQDLKREGFGAGERSENQVELLALRQQVEGLHRSLAAATSQLDNIRKRRASRRAQQQQPTDPVAARHHTIYGLLVEELHEIMGLPRPGHDH